MSEHVLQTMNEGENEMSKKIKVDKENAIELAKKLSIPSHSNGVEFITLDRLEVIQDELKESKYCYSVDEKIFRLYSQKKIEDINGEILLVSSHADCLQKRPVFEKESQKHPKRMIGIFDNAITNAACVYLMKYCHMPENVVFVFTGDEEAGMMGAYAVCGFLKSQEKSFHTLVLDCTYSAFEDKADFTLENDFIYKKDKVWFDCILECISNIDMKWKFIPAYQGQKVQNMEEYVDFGKNIAALKENHFCYDDGEIEEADEDESYKYDDRDVSCISLCLPCDADDMHSNKGFGIRRKNYYNYIKILYMLCECSD